MDWDVIASYLPQYEKAAWLTLRLGVIGIVWAIGIGLVCAVLQYDKVPVLRRLVGAYIQLSRNTPLLVQLFFIYYGLPKVGIKTNAEICGIAGLAFLGGSYMAERRTNDENQQDHPPFFPAGPGGRSSCQRTDRLRRFVQLHGGFRF